jgi:hypothetical protein
MASPPSLGKVSRLTRCEVFTIDRPPNQACRPEMRRISTSAPIRISIFLPRISPLEMRRVSSTKARANHVDDGALKLYSV